MTLTDDYFGFYFQDHDPYYDCITEFDGEDDLPDWIEVLLDIEVDRLIKERM